MKTSEEAQCTDPTCKWTYSGTVPTVSGIATSFDSTTNKWIATVTGQGIQGTSANVDLFVQGVKQETLSVSSTEAKFKIIEMLDVSSKNISFYTQDGLPKDHSTIQTAGVTLTPKLVSISPNSGSISGTIIIANVEGVGKKTTGLELVDSNGDSICLRLKITAYASLECLTVAKEIAAGS
jgi:hypothetical protein